MIELHFLNLEVRSKRTLHVDKLSLGKMGPLDGSINIPITLLHSLTAPIHPTEKQQLDELILELVNSFPA